MRFIIPAIVSPLLLLLLVPPTAHGKVADRSRLVKHRQATGKQVHYQDNGRPIEGQAYRQLRGTNEEEVLADYQAQKTPRSARVEEPWSSFDTTPATPEAELERRLSSQLSGCCYNYQKYSASNLCYLYGNDCSSGSSGKTRSHDSGDGDCSQQGLSFIGVSFSVNTASGNPYSYQLCDQFPMENIIDRDYEYVMSMDEDGWLVGGGYKQFDYSGKMPYVSDLA